MVFLVFQLQVGVEFSLTVSAIDEANDVFQLSMSTNIEDGYTYGKYFPHCLPILL